jgi:UDPglucose--hexose-1-phosphate uridylyltransferase
MPELRIDGLTGRRVYIAEDRAGRPSDYHGAPARPAQVARDYSETCPFCAGNEAATPHESAALLDQEKRWRVRVVPNKYPAVRLDTPIAVPRPDGSRVLDSSVAYGLHEVVIESPRHLTEVTELDGEQLTAVLTMFRDRLQHCKSLGLRHVTIFKNAGFAAGASLEHLHSQIVALPLIPPTIQTELDLAEKSHAEYGDCAYCRMISLERGRADRVVLEQSGYTVLSPYAARQPFELLILPELHGAHFGEVEDAKLGGLAMVLRELVGRLASVSHQRGHALAYNLVLHTAPFGPAKYADSYHWHWELIPRTTHLAGLEWGAGVYINPVSPERAARELRAAASP